VTSASKTRARKVIVAAEVVFLDFDGPITPLMPPPANAAAADAARQPLLEAGVSLQGELRTTTDHLAVLRFTAALAPKLVTEVEDACLAAELAVAATCQPPKRTLQARGAPGASSEWYGAAARRPPKPAKAPGDSRPGMATRSCRTSPSTRTSTNSRPTNTRASSPSPAPSVPSWTPMGADHDFLLEDGGFPRPDRDVDRLLADTEIATVALLHTQVRAFYDI